MCGIVGIFGKNAGAQHGQLQRMLAAVQSRGEVDETFCDEHVCVGVRRLKIVDRENAEQPIFSEDTQKFILFNGEIFNYKDIKKELEAKYTFRTNSDTETILHAYEAYGDQCVHKLDGQFAFVIYDFQNKTVFAARDHIGVVPLYFVRDDHALYISSVIKALTFLNQPIRVVPPGHTLDTHGNLRAYYTPSHDDLGLSNDQVAAQVKHVVQHAIKKRVDTDLPVGVIYSGGIDSSIVLHEVCKYHPDVTAFTIGTVDSEDFAVSQRFCKERGIKQVTIPLAPAAFGLANIKHAIETTELSEYLDIINAVISVPLFQRIHQEGIKIVLGGDGSDELFGGYAMYHDISEHEERKLFLYKLATLHKTELQRVDRCSMAFEVEARVPFLDVAVVDLALRIPRSLKINNGIEKWIVREAFKEELPDYILGRSKNPLSYSSGLHERVRMYKLFFAKYYNQYKFNLHDSIKMDFSYLLTKNGHDLVKTIEEEKLGKDYAKLELVKEAIKASIRTYMRR
jgi:asparagine synthase (glutamine-hydrolysing)